MQSFGNFMFRGITMTVLFFCFAFSGASAKTQVTGQIVETDKSLEKPMGYVTVVLMDSMDKTLSGTTTDANGHFKLTGDLKGNIRLVCSFVGYEKLEKTLPPATGQSDLNVGKLHMSPQPTHLNEVVVSARSITREADRFVVRMDGEKAIGRTALEVVSESPGVWVGTDQLSINGKSGTVVIVNNRVLNMSFEELKLYLSNLKAEDIQRIEIIPNGGVEYDANARGGIIKITLRRQRLDGIEGAVGTDFSYADHQAWDVRPNLNLNFKSGKFQAYGSGMVSDGHGKFKNWQSTAYQYSEASSIPSDSRGSESFGTITSKSNMGNFRLGGVYDISKQQSLGVEYSEFSKFRDLDHNLSTSEMHTETASIENKSLYLSDGSFHRRSITANYILQLDTLGSQLKIVGDFLSHKSPSSDVYANTGITTLWSDPLNPQETDTSYRTTTSPDYKVYTLTADLNYALRSGHKLSGGIKYYNNHMLSGQLFEEWHPGTSTWEKNDVHSYDNNYLERISAAYFKFSSKWREFSYSLGLRGEHTYAHPVTTRELSGTNDISKSTQQYINWFPNINISHPLNADGTNSLIFSYDRKISRPSFWQINPFKTQLSEYSYITGNPNLNPNITEDLSMTFVYHSKYTFTMGVTIEKDEIQQSGSLDTLTPNVFMIRFENIDRTYAYYADASLPFNPTQWWSMNLNLTGMYQKVNYKGDSRSNPAGFMNLTNSFTLPGGFTVDLNGHASSSFISGNMNLKPMYNVDLGVKRSFLNKKLTTSLRLTNLLIGTNDIRIKMLDKTSPSALLENPTLPLETLNYTRARFAYPTIRLSIRYTFSGGEKFKAKKVEASNDDVTKRLNQGEGGR